MKKIESRNLFHNKSFGLMIIRVIVGAVFLVHGYQKLNGIEATIGFFGSLGFSPFTAYLVAWIETLGGISLIIGFGSKVASGLLAIVTLVALVKVHAQNGFNVADGGYEFILTLFAVTLGLFYAGPGKYSVGASCGCPVKEGVCKADHCACEAK